MPSKKFIHHRARRAFQCCMCALFSCIATLYGWQLVHAAPADTITVTTNLDEYDSGAGCSLREAVQAANTDSAFGGCVAGSGADVIQLAADTYQLTRTGSDEDANATGDLDISSAITIQGASSDTTFLQAGSDMTDGIDRVLHILAAGSLTVIDSQVRYGLSPTGSGLYNQGGTLNLQTSAVRFNSSNTNAGGGIRTDSGQLLIENSTVSDNVSTPQGGGGMLILGGNVTITHSTLDNNRSRNSGGAINIQGGTLFITSSTLSNNRQTRLNYSAGGIQALLNSVITIQNSTLSGNQSVNGAAMQLRSGSQAVISQTTITNNNAPSGSNLNGALIARDAGSAIYLFASILGDNRGDSGIVNCNDNIISRGYNISQDNSCGFSETGDSNNTDPLLGTLMDNSGATLTHALLATSPAIDSAGNDCPAVDQRGAPRLTDGNSDNIGACDKGAYELEGPTLVTLEAFSAELISADGVRLSWQTSVEQNTVGFNLLRQSAADPAFIQINPKLIGAVGAAEYSWLDEGLATGVYTYTLQEVDIFGNLIPLGVTNITLTSPTAIGASSMAAQQISTSVLWGVAILSVVVWIFVRFD